MPIVVRSVIGRSWGQGAQHSQALYPLFMHIPGLRVLAPTTPQDAIDFAEKSPYPDLKELHTDVYAE